LDLLNGVPGDEVDVASLPLKEFGEGTGMLRFVVPIPKKDDFKCWFTPSGSKIVLGGSDKGGGIVSSSWNQSLPKVGVCGMEREGEAKRVSCPPKTSDSIRCPRSGNGDPPGRKTVILDDTVQGREQFSQVEKRFPKSHDNKVCQGGVSQLLAGKKELL
jgi:hypothetical protein